MRIRFLLCLFVITGGLSPLYGQNPVAPAAHSLSVKVDQLNSGGSAETHEGTHVSPIVNHPGEVTSIKNNQTQTNRQSEGIQITVRNFGSLPDSARVEWYFVDSPERPNSKKPAAEQQSIFDQGSQTVSLAPGGVQTIPVQSRDVTSTVKRHTQEHEGARGRVHQERRATGKKETGSVMSGWMVRVVADGRVIDSSASNDEFGEIAKDDAKFNVLKNQ
jgi:hypothetical protein